MCSAKLDDEAARLMKEYNLKPHPEGGYFIRIYESIDTVMSTDRQRYHDEMRRAVTSIYYLLNKNEYSAWHILKSDELWNFYTGSAVNIHVKSARRTFNLSAR